ncbi:UDP-glucose 4-epimerase GalE [Agromyces intestinalis]|uniref:UDP-glucose 4-epimerase n=1 Tax=Agromyces intestinalis TaxID=2592652 RepID=A0A5C1YBW2_9MICO|nr:UDP-glucose 4-epimerase GalE [Agromyces intestinalis]QEO13564.1 UDP-glucose 4-epimerase GalE [Agromyces intestinalis]
MGVLVTGGAGYIGAHVVRLLADAGRGVVVVDDLSTGRRQRVGAVATEHLDLVAPGALERLARVLREHEVDAVIHFAAKKRADESVRRPAWYYRQNVGGLVTVLGAMADAGVDRFVFSSSAAVYGDTPSGRVDESAPTRPMNPYGETKLVGEWLARAEAAARPMRFAALRYFNVAGAGWDDLGDPGVDNLVTRVLARVRDGLVPQVFGADYPTPDGSGVRDYVHVLDLAEAHVAALDYLDRERRAFDVFNVGRGAGASVLEVIDALGRAVGRRLDREVVGRRAGDPASVVADVERIARELGWRARFDLDEIARSAVAAARYADPHARP